MNSLDTAKASEFSWSIFRFYNRIQLPPDKTLREIAVSQTFDKALPVIRLFFLLLSISTSIMRIKQKNIIFLRMHKNWAQELSREKTSRRVLHDGTFQRFSSDLVPIVFFYSLILPSTSFICFCRLLPSYAGYHLSLRIIFLLLSFCLICHLSFSEFIFTK